jgi:outer membrane protein TolC
MFAARVVDKADTPSSPLTPVRAIAAAALLAAAAVGAESLLGVLEAERTALGAREQLVTAQRDLATATSRAHLAVAGGFDQPSRQLARASGG